MKHVCIIELMPIPQTIGGVPTHIIELAKSLAEKGWKVSVISSKSEEKSDLKIKNIDFYHVGLKHKKFEDFKGIKKPYYLIWRFFFEISFIISSYKLIKKLSPDIINTEGLASHAIPAYLSGKPFVSTAHGIHSYGFKKLYKLKGQKIFSNIFSKIFLFLETFIAKRAKKIICLGKDTFNFYSKYGSCIIIPNAINTSHYAFKNKSRKKKILFVGRLSQEKGLDKLLKAISMIKSSCPKIFLEILGKGKEKEKLKELKKGMDIEDIINWSDYIEHKELKKKYQGADLFVLPSTAPENSPLSILESMSQGTPVITTNLGGQKELVKHGKTGFLVRPRDSKDLAQKIKIILEDKKLQRKMSKNCLKEARKFSPEEHVKKIEELFSSLIDRKRKKMLGGQKIKLPDYTKFWDGRDKNPNYDVGYILRRRETANNILLKGSVVLL